MASGRSEGPCGDGPHERPEDVGDFLPESCDEGAELPDQ